MTTEHSGGWRLVRARRDAQPRSVRRSTEVLPRRRRRLVRQVLAGVAAVVLVGAGVWTVYGSSLLGVDEVRVVGARVLTQDQVRQAAGVRTGTPLARLDPSALRRRVAALPPVARASVARDWPGTVVIRVEERTGVAAVPMAGQYVIIDGSGVPFRTIAGRPATLPLLVLDRPGAQDAATRAALRVLAALTPELRAALVRLVAPGPARIRLELAKGRTIVWGDAEDSDKKARVATSLLARPGKIIDVSAPEVVTVR